MRLLTLILTLAMTSTLWAAGGTSAPNHSEWNSLLQRYVNSSGVVNYSGFAKDALLEEYIQILSGSHPDESWSRNEQMAYWINAYNAFTVQLIIDNMPLSSIKDIGDPWDKKFITIEGNTYSLNDIENTILRPKYKDARIHFAINCAAKSCPPLSNRAFTANGLDAQLAKVSKAFVTNAKYNTISSDSAELSSIFDWFASDFTAGGGVADFINRHSNVTLDGATAISYTDYDWKLNGK